MMYDQALPLSNTLEVGSAKRDREVAAAGRSYVTGRCPSGKRAHLSRKSAKRHEHSLVGQHLRAYRCPDCELWHVGHLPRRAWLGEVDARDYYAAG